MAKPKEAFISHSSRDIKFASKLVELLSVHNVKTFYTPTSIKGAQEIAPKNRRGRRYRERIIPVLHRTCDPAKLSWTLSGFQHVDFRKNFERAAVDLLGIWKLKYKGSK
jgi:hypothetical protein